MSWSVVAVFVAALCFSTTGTAQALADVDASPWSVGAARILIGGGMLGLVALATRRRSARTRGTASASVRIGHTRVAPWLVVAIGAIGVLAYQPAFFAGTRANGVAIGTVIALGSAPVITGALDAALTRRMPSRRWVIATAIAVAGVVLVSGVIGAGAVAGVDILGVLASLGAGTSYAVYAIAAKTLLDRAWTPFGAMGAIFGVAAVFSIPVLLASPLAWLFTPEGAALALWLGVVTTALAYALFGWGLRRLPASTAATLTLAEPLAATLLGVFVLGEHLSAVSLGGLVVIAAGLAMLSIPPRKETTRVAAPA